MCCVEYAVGIRLDNDDTLGKYYISFLDDCLAYARTVKRPPLAFNFPYQFAIVDGRVYLHVATDSNATAIWERVNFAKTPYWVAHPKMWEQCDMIECGTRFPMVAIHRHPSNAGERAWESFIAIENGREVAGRFFAAEIFAQ